MKLKNNSDAQVNLPILRGSRRLVIFPRSVSEDLPDSVIPEVAPYLKTFNLEVVKSEVPSSQAKPAPAPSPAPVPIPAAPPAPETTPSPAESEPEASMIEKLAEVAEDASEEAQDDSESKEATSPETSDADTAATDPQPQVRPRRGRGV